MFIKNTISYTFLLWCLLFAGITSCFDVAAQTGDTLTHSQFPDVTYPFCRTGVSTGYTEPWVVHFQDSVSAETFFQTKGLHFFWKWDFGDGTTAIGREVYHAYSTPGTHTATLYKAVYDTIMPHDSSKACVAMYFDIRLGQFNPCYYKLVCETRDTIQLKIDQTIHPECRIFAAYTSQATDFTFTDTLTDPFEGNSSIKTFWLWDFGDGAHAEGKKVDHTYASTNEYTATVTKVCYFIPEGPYCMAFLYDSTYGISVPCYYKPLCKVSQDLIINSSYPEDDRFCQADIAWKVNAGELNFSDNAATIDTAIHTQLFWSWDFGDGIFSTDTNGIHTYATPGKYQVKLTKAAFMIDDEFAQLCYGVKYDSALHRNIFCAYSPLCRNTYTMVVNIDSVTSLCAAKIESTNSGLTITLNDALNNSNFANVNPSDILVGWKWSFEDGAILKGQQATHTFSTGGAYTVKLTKAVFQRSIAITTPCNYYPITDPDFGIIIPCNFSKTCEQTYIFITTAREDGGLCSKYISYQVLAKQNVRFTEDISTVPGLNVYYYFNYGDGTSGSSMSHHYSENGVYRGNFTRAVYRAVETLVACPIQKFDTTLQVDNYCGMELVCKETFPIEVNLPDNDSTCFSYQTYHLGAMDSIVFQVSAPYDTLFLDSAKTVPVFCGWVFGDNTLTTGPKVSHIFTNSGDYNVCLYTGGMDKLPCCKTISIKVNNVVAGVDPQPFTDNGTFYSTNIQGKYDVRFFDLNGRTVKSVNNNSDASFQLDGQGFQSGLYFYEILNAGRIIYRGKIIVQ